ncbi:MAG: hypothetical protein ACR2LX_17735 [Jatrophihabitans sp.]
MVATAVAIVGAVAFAAVRPNVGDLQAALARESAARHGVGLTYWYGWFGGGSTPGNYSVIVPTLTAWFGTVLLGVLATVAITPLAWLALARLPYRVAGTWVATIVAGFNLWSGRIPFALGCAVGIVALMAARERWNGLTVGATIVSSLCSPVTGLFVAVGLFATFLVRPENRRTMLVGCGACLSTLLLVALVFTTPGPQPYTYASAALTAGSALAMLYAKPNQVVRATIWCTALAAPVIATIPNGLGSNLVRLPWICLPAVAVATANALPKWRILVAVLPALALCANATVADIGRADVPSASPSYYQGLIGQLKPLPNLANSRLEVVGNPRVHTAAFVLLGHAALAGGYETQEQNELNAILSNRAGLDDVSYKVWLDNNAVGYVALDRAPAANYAEYDLVSSGRVPYLTKVSQSKEWVLYRVGDATPIVPRPQRLLQVSQSEMRIQVPCACSFYVRIRYSKFLRATAHATDSSATATLADDGNGWTIVTAPRAGVYVLDGDLTRSLK